MSEINLDELQQFLVQVARHAGYIITSSIPSTAGLGSKKNSIDLVTEVDQRVEDYVSSTLKEKYPNFEFMGEESYKPGDSLKSNATFVIDPIDGTTNFVHGYPYVSISLAIAINFEPTVGVVYNPFSGVLYSGIAGQGSFKSIGDGPAVKLPIFELEPLDELQKSLVAIEWGSDRSGLNFEIKAKTFARLCREQSLGGGMVRGLRSFGSVALNMCAIAEGSIDICWENGCSCWDVCAGWVILKEAGGIIVDGNPGNWNPRVDDRRYLALRKGATHAVVEEFWSKIEGNLEYDR